MQGSDVHPFDPVSDGILPTVDRDKSALVDIAHPPENAHDLFQRPERVRCIGKSLQCFGNSGCEHSGPDPLNNLFHSIDSPWTGRG